MVEIKENNCLSIKTSSLGNVRPNLLKVCKVIEDLKWFIGPDHQK